MASFKESEAKPGGSPVQPSSRWVKEVERLDFRRNLIVDPNNPMLIQKAWRDRFSKPSHWGAGYGGEAYLCRRNSEDALTWNVFRSLQRVAERRGVSILEQVFGIAPIRQMLFWGCDVESASDVQQYLNCLIRAIDGRHGGTLTEPDLVIITDREVAFVECKLNRSTSGSPWMARSEGAEKRLRTYRQECGFAELASIADWRPVYQLIRQYVYAQSLASLLGKKGLVFPLISETCRPEWASLYRPLMQFNGEVFRPFVTWQSIRDSMGGLPRPEGQGIIAKIEEALQAATRSVYATD